jgi:hypothetical protein
MDIDAMIAEVERGGGTILCMDPLVISVRESHTIKPGMFCDRRDCYAHDSVPATREMTHPVSWDEYTAAVLAMPREQVAS